MLESSIVRLKFKGRLLLLKRPDNDRNKKGWCLPGGKFEKRETPLECVQRELFEETGIAPFKVSLIYISEYMSEYKGSPIKIHVFDGEVIGSKLPIVTVSSEHVDFKWLTLDEALRLELAGKTSVALNLEPTKA